MASPTADRPYMPGYGILPADQGTGLLPWSWAQQRLATSHDYWVSSVKPDGRPHVMPVWGVWLDDALWFSSSLGSRKVRNLVARPDCVVTTDNPRDPVVLEGSAEVIRDQAGIKAFLDALNAKYATHYPLDFLDPAVNASLRVRPGCAFGLAEGDFTGSPTRWSFT
ncbi:pyridoxamine 5'-phosphate oxidase family protein [Kitasatospora sp. MAP5-34]|uniref:pyridoxamine 5'-phosphate oxidase family protein n=1 Tax=Kitasatospora sp. MAP5-34 TaxID=3035102 RepID=UPI002474C5B2|nr:pyridoxamine 5'-phosphate oxidase family protein [Kitasatospora sp. MAP5-34]MDH6575113.1 PPOX class probable F420-dependent enzyme [Kitasatospora sp. MAP5-34]